MNIQNKMVTLEWRVKSSKGILRDENMVLDDSFYISLKNRG